MDEIDLNSLELLHINLLDNADKILSEYLKEVSSYFYPSLESFVDINNYTKKILCKAYVCLLKNKENNILGHYAIYLNDSETKIAFITSIGVFKKYEGKGIAKILLTDAIEKAKMKGMYWCKLETNINNQRAISFYKKNGFREVYNSDKSQQESLFMIKNIS